MHAEAHGRLSPWWLLPRLVRCGAAARSGGRDARPVQLHSVIVDQVPAGDECFASERRILSVDHIQLHFLLLLYRQPAPEQIAAVQQSIAGGMSVWIATWQVRVAALVVSTAAGGRVDAIDRDERVDPRVTGSAQHDFLIEIDEWQPTRLCQGCDRGVEL